MNQDNLKYLEKRFFDYVKNFYTDDPDVNKHVKMKESHTKRVCENITTIGKSLDMSPHDLLLAHIMALYHDFGRFLQYKTFRTFNDWESINHAILGLREMARFKILSVCQKEEKRIIIKAIAYHNAMTTHGIKNKEDLLFIRLLRDADKLDIWKVFQDYYTGRENKPDKTLVLDLPDEPFCSETILKAMYNFSIASINDVKTQNDYKLIQIGWVYDLNFPASFKMVQDRNIIQELASTLPKLKGVTKAVQQAIAYVQLKCQKIVP
jgi:hypothetical protein